MNRVAAVLVVLGAIGLLALRGCGADEGTVAVHDGEPAFTLAYDDALVEEVAAEPGELLRLRGERKDVVATLSARPLRLPAYEGQPTGALPVAADNYARARGLRLTTDTRARVDGMPGYELGYEGGVTLLLLAEDAPGARDGVVLTVAETEPGEQGGGQRVSRAIRSALRSLEFGADRD